jgi:hypothetical protein
LATPPAFQAIPELSVIPLPDAYDLHNLDGKTLKEQLQSLFEMRLWYVNREFKERYEKKDLLEKGLKP